MSMLKCPSCNCSYLSTRIIHGWPIDRGTARKRLLQCFVCNSRFHTVERFLNDGMVHQERPAPPWGWGETVV